MVRKLVDKSPELSDYLQDYLNDGQIREQIYKIGREGFIDKGRGVVVVDLRRFSQNLVRFYYLSAGNNGEWQDPEMAQVCQNYNPEQEVIVFLFFEEFSAHNDCYKIAAHYE